MRIVYGLVLLAGLLALAPACQKLAEKASEKMVESAFEKSNGGQAQVDLDSKSGTMKVESNDGKTQMQYGENAALPADWPAWLEQYPGSKVMLASKKEEGDKTSCVATLSTTDTPDAVVKFYEEKASAQGLKGQNKLTMPDNGSMESFIKDDQILTVTGVTGTGKDGNTISIVYEFKTPKAG